MIAKIAVNSVLKGMSSWVALIITAVALSIVLTLNVALIIAGVSISGEAQQAYVSMGGVALSFTVLTGIASFSLVVSTCLRLQRRDVALWQIAGILPRTALVILLLEVLLVSATSAVIGVLAAIAVWPAYAGFVGHSGLPHSEVLQQNIPTLALIIGVGTTAVVSVLTGIRTSRNVVQTNLVESVRASSAFWGKTPSLPARLLKSITGVALVAGVIAIYLAIGHGKLITDQHKIGDFLTTYPGMGILLCLTFAVIGSPLIRVLAKLTTYLPGNVPHFLASREVIARPSLTTSLVLPISLAAAAVGVMTTWVEKLKDILYTAAGSSDSVSAPPEQMALLLAGPVIAACVSASSIVFATASHRQEDNALLVVSGSTPSAAYIKAVVEVLIYTVISLVCAYVIIVFNEGAMVLALSAGPIPSAPFTLPGLAGVGVVALGMGLTLVMLMVVTLAGFRKQSIMVVLGGK
ncbi:ABC transporter permease [Corynebacterium sp. 3HC-13]|nr:ABC transporter permease [Corynebacterium poyangense]